METAVLGGASMAAAAMPILLVVLLSLVGVTLVAVGGGLASREMRSRKMTAVGSLCLLGVVPATKATTLVATGFLVGAGAGTGLFILVTIVGLLILASSL